MKRNTASQTIGAQLVTASDGSEFTGSVTVYVTGDGGAQAVGSVGAGACTHEGHGYHSYAPAQAETNFDHVAFTFVGSGAVPATVQLYTQFPQTGDGFSRLGAPAGASVAADVAAVKAVLPAALVSGRIDASVGAMAANVMTAAAAAGDLTTELQAGLATSSALTAVAGDVTSVKSKTDGLPTDPADQSLIIAATDAVMARLGAPAGASMSADIAAVKVDTAAISTAVDTEVAAIKAKTDLIPAAPAAVGDIPTTGAIADAVWDEAVDGSVTARQSFRLANSALGGKASGLETTAAVFRDLADTKDRITATVDADGNRTAVTRDLT